MDVPSDKPKEPDGFVEYPTPQDEALDVGKILKDLKEIVANDEDPKEQLADFIESVEKKMVAGEVVDRERIRELILKHPFFKNPNHYYIRLITIMKYLKKKGLDVRIRDIDLVVDEIITSIEGVKKIGEDRYALKK